MSSDQLPEALRERLPSWVPTSLTGLIGVALLIGVPLGLLAHGSDAVASMLSPLVFIGDLFIKCLKLLILPIIVTSLVVGVGNVGDVARLGRLGGKTAIYYFGTTLLAAILGLLLVNVIRPGDGASLTGYDIPEKAQAGKDMGVGDMLWRIFGETLLHPIDSLREGDIITVIAVTLVFGIVLILAGDRGRPVLRGFQRAEALVMAVVHNIMWLAPLGVVGLLIAAMQKSGLGLLVDLGKYCVTVLLGVGLHGFLVLPLIVLLVARRKPLEWLRGIRPAMAVALSTSSSSATLPVTIQSVEENLDVPTPIASFVLPLGATMNMDGTALYEAVAALFVAQALGIDLGMGQQMVVLLTAMAASVGAAGIPSAGIVTMVMVFESVGLPLEPLGAIYAVDRVLDMCRTVVNVMGDTAGAVVLDRLEGTGAAATPA